MKAYQGAACKVVPRFLGFAGGRLLKGGDLCAQAQQCPLQLWPAPGAKDESNSSSDEQTTAYGVAHSHHSRQSRDGHTVSPSLTHLERAERAIEVSSRDSSQLG